jgi:outer membrane protein TolC/protein-S-isoprenylcysteine O-methyltransferase Ste14
MRDRDHPGVIAPPPLLFLSAIVTAIVLDSFAPAPAVPQLLRIAGGALIAAALVLAAFSFREFRRARTSFETRRPTTAVLTTGPFRWTRNPLYLGLTSLTAGLGLALDRLWVLPLLVPVLWVLHRGVILREERYLEAKFGDEYRRYRASVRRWFAIAALVVGLGGLATSRAADSPSRLTVADAASRAVAQFPDIAAANARRDVARQELGEAKAVRLPSLELQASAVRHEEPMPVTPIHGLTPGSFPHFDDLLLQSSLQADWLLFDGGGRGARIDQRRSLLLASDADAKQGEQAVIRRTVGGYLEVLGTSRTLGAHDRLLAALESEERRVGQLHEVGRAPDVELRRIEAKLASGRAERVRLAAALDTAERNLARLVGAGVDETRADRLAAVTLADTALRSREALLEEALAANSRVRAAEQRAAAAKAALDASRARRWPTLRLTGNYLSFGDSEAEMESEWNAGVKLSLPIFTGGAIRSRIGQSQFARAVADAELRSTRLQLEEELDRALAATNEARALVESLALAVAQFAEVARIEKLRLESEVGTQTDYLEAEADLLATEAKLVEARHAEITARVELARVTGELDLAWVGKMLEAAP